MLGKVIRGNQRHPDSNTGLRQKCDAHPVFCCLVGVGEFATQSRAGILTECATQYIYCPDHPDCRKRTQVKRGAGENKKYHHERPLDAFDGVKRIFLMSCEIRDNHAHYHRSDQKGHVQPEYKSAADEYDAKRLGENGLPLFDASGEVSRRQP